MFRKNSRISPPLFLIWLLLGSLMFITLVNPAQGLFTAAVAFSVFLGLSGAEKLHLI